MIKMELLDLPIECLSLIKSHLTNLELRIFNATCSYIENVPLSRIEISARRCDYHRCNLDEINFKCGHLECIKYLLNRDNYLLQKNDKIFRMACKNGHLDSVEYILPLVNKEIIRSSENYAIRIAAKKGYHQIVNLLIKNGVSLEDIRSRQNYAIKYATKNGHIEIVKILLESGLTSEDIENSNLLYLAGRNNDIDIMKLLLSFGPFNIIPIDLLSIGSIMTSGYHRVIKLLIQSGLDPNFLRSHQYLSYSAINGRTKLTKFLVKNIFTIEDFRNNDFPIFLIVDYDDINILRIIFSKGLNFNDDGITIRTLFIKSITASRFDLLDLLISNYPELTNVNWIHHPIRLSKPEHLFKISEIILGTKSIFQIILFLILQTPLSLFYYLISFVFKK